MQEPDFSESQLQQTVNSAIERHLYITKGVWLPAHIPSLIEEFDLGWDSAFCFSWLPQIPDNKNYGCNVFIQYKLSGQLTGPTAKEWKYWERSYLRFKIPYSIKTQKNKFEDDYHQWCRLKEIADQKYPTFYATNSMLYRDVLHKDWSNGTLLDSIPLLDVRKVTLLHKHVTFTPDSQYFLMHSDHEEIKKMTLSDLLRRFPENGATSLIDSTKTLFALLKEMRFTSEFWTNDISKIEKALSDERLASGTWFIHAMLAAFIEKHIGAQMLWIPQMSKKEATSM